MMMTAEELLRSKGVKPTAQRVVITQFLLNNFEHPTADEVLEGVKERLPVALSRATVYNTLNALVEAGVIREVTLEAGRVRYDANMVEHHHFMDVKSGKIIDIPWEKVPQLCQSLGAEYTIHDYQITFYGEIRSDTA
jgi:Fe2+ or Zn2+ uptake regulation protein